MNSSEIIQNNEQIPFVVNLSDISISDLLMNILFLGSLIGFVLILTVVLKIVKGSWKIMDTDAEGENIQKGVKIIRRALLGMIFLLLGAILFAFFNIWLTGNNPLSKSIL